MGNKVKFNLKNVHAAKLTEKEDETDQKADKKSDSTQEKSEK